MAYYASIHFECVKIDQIGESAFYTLNRKTKRISLCLSHTHNILIVYVVQKHEWTKYWRNDEIYYCKIENWRRRSRSLKYKLPWHTQMIWLCSRLWFCCMCCIFAIANFMFNALKNSFEIIYNSTEFQWW